MNTDFPRTLALLRREKGVSQKEASKSLGVSPALLSHYENGVREPGLAFVVAAADYYDVSADFLLGRSMSRDGTFINAEELYDDADAKDNRLKGSAAMLFSKKIIVNAVAVIFDLLGRSGGRSAVKDAYGYLSSALYKLFRYLYATSGTQAERFFSVPAAESMEAADARMKLCEMRLKRSIGSGEAELPQLSNDSLTRDYPLLVQSLFSMLHATEKELARLGEDEEQ